MSGAVTDVRDVLGLESGIAEPRQAPLRKQKTFEKRPDGITRELYALLGDNAPPVSIVDGRFKDKPKWFGKPSPWEFKEFANEGRRDDLRLSHWVRKLEDNPEEPPAYQFAKFNIQISIMEYDNDEYDKALRNDQWSKAETDYLFGLLREYDLRWVIVADRYEYEGSERTMEDMKARYYSVCRNLMEHRLPIDMMSGEQLATYNALKYDKEQETERKRVASLQMYRSAAEVETEQQLVAELRRINDSYQSLLEEREDLFQRLDFPQSSGSIAAYQGSQGLAQLAQSLLATDRNRKRKSIAAAAAGQNAETKTEAAAAAVASPAVQRRESVSQPEAKGHHQRDSTVSASGTAAATPKDKKQQKEQPAIRTLSKAEEAEYGISHHEKLQPGVFARSQKMNIPKGASYNAKSIPILTELGIAPALVMPTTKVVAKYEQLCQEIALLLDAKRAVEKVDQETKVFKAQEAMGDTASGVKRSASVMSDTPKSTKKPKKEK